jgi:uncharacterized beta-barrel protein YwiB (DUF1934 family)
MKQKAVISIVSNQMSIKADAIEVRTPGVYYKEKDFYLAEYDETELSGMEGTTTRLEIYPEKLILIREGTTATKMEFEKGKEYISLYNTPYGMMELKIQTKILKVSVDEFGGEIFIDYKMGAVGQKPLKTELKINIKAQ